MSVIDNAIQRLQVLALASSSDIRSAPDYPVDDAKNLPLVITHIANGEGTAVNATDCQFEPVISVDFHFSRVILKDAYQKIDALIPAFIQRLAGDPTLNGTIDTIQFPVSFEVLPAEWDRVTTEMARFTIPVKTLETPIST